LLEPLALDPYIWGSEGW